MKARKTLEKALAGSKNIRFGDFVTLIEKFGFTLERIRGSHHIFSHPDLPQTISAQPDKNKQAKPYQLRQFLRLVEKHDLKLENAEQEKSEENKP